MRKIFLFCLCGLLCVPGLWGQQGEKFMVTDVKAVVTPTKHVGKCPQTFLFAGRITANKKGVVKYLWERSDGTKSSIRIARFTGPGTQIVTTTWTLGDFGESYKDYWQVLHILSPNKVSTNEAVFNLICSSGPGEDKSISFVDIAVTHISIDERCRLHVTHKNLGTQKLSVVLREKIWVDKKLIIDTKEAIIAEPGQSFSHPAGSQSGLFVPYLSTIKVTIDADNQLREVNEKNNTLIMQVNCRK